MAPTYQPEILIVGPGRSGKDESGLIIPEISTFRFGGCTSLYLCRHVAERMGVSEEYAYEHRHENRDVWRRIGDEVRSANPGRLMEDALQHGPVVGGIRASAELDYAVEKIGFRHVVWMERNVPKDPTLEFDLPYIKSVASRFSERTTVSTIQNNGTIRDLKRSWIEFFRRYYPYALREEYQL